VSATQKLLRFGVYELNLDTVELRKSGTLLKLPPQPFKLLAYLAEHAGQIVTREEIQSRLWGDETHVDFEHGVNKCIKQIRTVLSDHADQPLYIETLPRQGYRFLAPVVSKTIAAPAPRVLESKSGELSRMGTLVGGAVPSTVGGTSASGVERAIVARVLARIAAAATQRDSPATPAPSVAAATKRALAARFFAEPASAPELAAESMPRSLDENPSPRFRLRRRLLWIGTLIALLAAAVGVYFYWRA